MSDHQISGYQASNNKIDPNSFAQESDKTKRAREKLRNRLDLLEKKITEKDLQRAIVDIHERISLYASDRVPLREKSIALFDNNQHPAKSSAKVAKFAQKIHENSTTFLQSQETANNLHNRSIEVR